MSDPKRCKSMALEVQADLARESEREAKGVSWDLHQRECDRNEALEYEIETLKAKVAELEYGLADAFIFSEWVEILGRTDCEIYKYELKSSADLSIQRINKLIGDKLEAGTL